MSKRTLKSRLIAVFQRSYRRSWMSSRIYWTLAKRESRELHREIFQQLALKAERSAVRYAIRLSRLRGSLPSNQYSLGDRLWCWILSHCPLRWALAWLGWLEKRNIKDLHTFLVLKWRTLSRSTDRSQQKTHDEY
ncbi:hypothetical protein [Chroogloeocystis siderophila]|uniref:Uncharacterized protein n=1 Tax=Chroogloeocystis siderophila 5.2 s.c.1 TaxID=247279 RepID=A0A1U7HYM2_9CHRO|nr:hypothetical protein [Chroogloeocystis siderophila]OKH28679.1 hypothetical protein NIES1031_01825 [Chroogloeocystis siderophila 5.2 s.c.1]